MFRIVKLTASEDGVGASCWRYFFQEWVSLGVIYINVPRDTCILKRERIK